MNMKQECYKPDPSNR